MPIEFGIWRIDQGITPVPSSPLENEARLEDVLAQDLSILGLDVLMLLGRQVITAFGTRIDLFAIDAQGDLYVIELKRGRTPREVVAQAIDYGYWVRDLEHEQVRELFERSSEGGTLDQAFRDAFRQPPPEVLNESHHLIVVASELDSSTERMLNYVSDYGVPVNVVFFQYFRDGEREYIARSWLIDPVEAEATARTPSGRRVRAPWNGQDFYVSFGEAEPPNDRRRWEDAVKYGFVSAGGGLWYSRSLNSLFPGARVFACIPNQGYVGVGTVRETAQRVSECLVDVNGVPTPLLEAPLTAMNMADGANDPELSEYVVRVEWIKTLPREQAIWERDMYANQNSATKLRNQFTLERLTARFNLDSGSE